MSLPAPGSPTYIPALIGYLQAEIATSGEEWSIDPTLLSSLLLSQIVGPERGGVIVDVLSSKGRRDEGIIKTVENVQAITRGIFGKTTHHIHLSRHTHPSDLPYALFLDPDESWPDTHTHMHPSSPPVAPRRPSRRSTISTPSSKYTSALPSPIFPRSYLSRGSRTPTPGVTPGITPKSSFPFLTSNLGLEPKSEYGFGPPLVLPGRAQLVETPDEVGQPRKAPSLPQCLVISGLERAESPVWGKLADILLKGYVEVPSEPTGSGQSDSLGSAHVGDHKVDRWDFPEGFCVLWVREEEKSEKCPSWLIDHFSCSVSVHPDDLYTPPSIPLRAMIPPSYIKALNSLLPYTHIHPPLQTHISNLFSALSAHPRLRSSITGRAALIYPEYVRAHRLISAPFNLPDGWEKGVVSRWKIRTADGGTGTGMNIGTVSRMEKREGDVGVVRSWGILAGEEPILAELGAEDGPEGTVDVDQQWDLDVDLGNIHSVFALALRHRIAWRGERNAVMWLVKGSAAGRSGGAGAEELSKIQKENRRERRRRREVDIIMEDILAVV